MNWICQSVGKISKIIELPLPPGKAESVSIKQELAELPEIDPEQLLGFRYIQEREDDNYKAEVVCVDANMIQTNFG